MSRRNPTDDENRITVRLTGRLDYLLAQEVDGDSKYKTRSEFVREAIRRQLQREDIDV